MTGIIDNFSQARLPGAGVEIDALIGGSGPPLLLLHGYPQTRMAFKTLAPLLAECYTLVIPDLRGYGRSDKPAGDPAHERYSKREMARDQIATMAALGFKTFAVAGHDRGARIAYRLALDHPGSVERAVIMDVIPTAEQWAKANAEFAFGIYHWFMLAQPPPLPETLIAGDPEFFYRWTLESWAGKDFEFDPESLADYLACMSSPASIHASCEDYRAGWSIDRAHDEADRGKRFIEAPLLVLWGEAYRVAKTSPLDIWKNWARDLQGQGMPGGHYQAEEATAQTAAAMLAFLAQG